MRILLVSDHDFLPDRVGGRESSIDELANTLCGRGHQVSVLARAKTRGTRRPTGAIHWPISYQVERVGNVFGVAERYLAADKFDFALYSVKGFSGRYSAADHVRWRQVLYVRDATEIDGWTDDTFAPSQVLLANSAFIADRVYQRTGLTPHLVPPVIDFSKYRVDEIGGHVTFINPVYEKGTDLAFELAGRHPDIPFLFVLCWDLEEQEVRRLEREAKSLGNVSIAEARLDARDIYRSTRLLLVPSRWEEGFGRVVLEAQCNGIPVIASARGGLPEAVGDGGVLIDGQAGVDAWSGALTKLWNDQALWNEFSAKAGARAREFQEQVETTVVALETIIGQISHEAGDRDMLVPKCLAIILPSSGDGPAMALQSLIDQNCDHLEIVALHLRGQQAARPDHPDADNIRYLEFDPAENLSRQVIALARDAQCAFVALFRRGDLVAPDFVDALSNAHLNSLWTAAVALCDVGVVDRHGNVTVSSSSNFKSMATEDSDLQTFQAHEDTFGLSAIAMPWDVAGFGRLATGLMFRRDALLMLNDPPAFEDDDALLGYLRFGAHLVGGTIYIDRVLCWSSEPRDSLRAALPSGQNAVMDDAQWDSIVAQLVDTDIGRYLRPGDISRTLFGHLPRQRVLSLCERHPRLRDILMKAFLDDAKSPASFDAQ